MNGFFTVLLLPVVWLGFLVVNILQNYRRAAIAGVPRVIAPVSPDNQIWIALQTGLSPLLRRLHLFSSPAVRYCRLGWEFHDRYHTAAKLGDAWMLVTPARNWLYVSDAPAAFEILSRYRDFGRPVWMLAMLDVFGPNLSTAEGPDWQRQRKLTATPFNEQKSCLVWTESVRQAKDMLRHWLSHGSDGFNSSQEDTRTLALDVLAYVAFQKSYPWQDLDKNVDMNQALTYRDSLSIILRNVLVILVLPKSFFSFPFLPAKIRQIGEAMKEFKSYMLSQLAQEKELEAKGLSSSGTLMSNLVRASSEQAQSKISRQQNHKPLSENEILGNVFVFNFAGHDTTAISLAYAVMLLVSRDDIQSWIAEELTHYLDESALLESQYEVAFPKLKRCLAVLVGATKIAVLLETLRLYNPLPGIPKYTSEAQSLNVAGQTVKIPSDTLVVPMLQALHTQPKYWGQNSLDWEPRRWIITESLGHVSNKGERLANERVLEPVKGSFVAWSEGIRNCPGKKFAQVEFVAVMATLFRDHVVRPIQAPGETALDAKRRVANMVKDSKVDLLLEMQNAKSILVAWEKRSEATC